jgi:hypothetical protein
MATHEEYVAEATAIREHLIPLISAIELIGYIVTRCDSYAANDPSFDREWFIRSCVRGDDAPARKVPR